MKKSKFFGVVAIIAGITGAVVAASKYMQKKGISIRKALDYKNDIFGEDENQEDIYTAEENSAQDLPEDVSEDTGDVAGSENDVPFSDIDDDYQRSADADIAQASEEAQDREVSDE